MSEDMSPLEKRKMLFELTVSLIAAETSQPQMMAEKRIAADFDKVYKLLSGKWESFLVQNTK